MRDGGIDPTEIWTPAPENQIQPEWERAPSGHVSGGPRLGTVLLGPA